MTKAAWPSSEVKQKPEVWARTVWQIWYPRPLPTSSLEQPPGPCLCPPPGLSFPLSSTTNMASCCNLKGFLRTQSSLYCQNYCMCSTRCWRIFPPVPSYSGYYISLAWHCYEMSELRNLSESLLQCSQGNTATSKALVGSSKPYRLAPSFPPEEPQQSLQDRWGIVG